MTPSASAFPSTSTSKPKKKTSTAVKRGSSSKTSTPQPQPLAITSKQSKRLFTQEDEIQLPKSLKNPTKNPFPDSPFSEAQITAKLKRLKQKYHKLAKTKSSIKTPHDRKFYELARQIWGRNTPVGDDGKKKGSDGNEEAVNWNDYPFLMKRVSRAYPETVELYKEGLKGLTADIVKGLNESWMMLEMEEAEIAAKKAQLCHRQMKLIVEASNNNA